MRGRDVHLTEMLRFHPLRDPEIEEVLSGIVPENRPDLAEVAAFVADVSASAAQAAPPQLGPSLAVMLATGLTPTDKSDLPATAASNAHGPA
ncbi:MAG: hypothetical protein M3R01_14525, partial [Actinomycetota bacterium]|nr:hypothetical protein [Actinomycetota bacterium]